MRKLYLIWAVGLVLLMAVQTQAATRLELSPSLTLSEQYSTNVQFDEEDEESAWISIISPGITLSWFGKTFSTNLTYAPGFTLYDHDESNSTVRHRGTFSATIQPSQYVDISLRNSFERTDLAFYSENATEGETRIDLIERDQEFDDPYYTNTARAGIDVHPTKNTDFGADYRNTIREEREPYTLNQAGGYLENRFGDQDRIRLGYRFLHIDSRDPQTEDSRSHTPSLNLDYWFTEHWGLENTARYERAVFPDNEQDDFNDWFGRMRLVRAFSKHFRGSILYSHTYHDFDEDQEQDFQVYNPAVGIDWDITEMTSLTADVGYFYRDIMDEEFGDEEDEDGLTLDGGLDTEWRVKRGYLQLTGSGGYDQNYQSAENLGFSIFYQASAIGEYQLTEELGLFVEASYRWDKFLDEEPERTDEEQNYSAGLRYALTRWLSFTLQNTYRRLDSDEERREYKENRTSLSMTIAPRPFRID
jgi:hypothetical protein